MKRKAIGYVRVSTQKQAQDGLSLDAQTEKIKQWARYHDYDLVHIYIDEGISGKKVINRPKLKEALNSLEKDMIFVFYSLSRVSRNTIDTLTIAEYIHKTGADMVSLSENIDTTGPTGRMVFGILAVLNQFERDQVSERTKMVIDYLRSNDKVYSHVPYGYDKQEDNLVKNQDEQNTIVLMLKMKDEGFGYRKIATSLNKKGIKSKKGGIWYAKTVEGVLRRYPQGYSA
ncbi:recombinase family protein [Acinetobacter indicus]|uniref:recombinase family protein n=1 Tax=Acinetobacter indicus TaxID=756892 RepID=UPI00209AD629|nr:recombinase family protein [Acinetobacter indicus]MCO8088232.1 recombinase family protein [Acinetobacter indicus]